MIHESFLNQFEFESKYLNQNGLIHESKVMIQENDSFESKYVNQNRMIRESKWNASGIILYSIMIHESNVNQNHSASGQTMRLAVK